MKKLTIFVAAFVLALGLAQCKKQETPDTPNAEYNWVHINMKVNGGERYDIDPNTGTAGFTDGDQIYVSNGGKYRGVLTYSDSDSTFTGALAYDEENPMDTDDNLHFYFFGGTNPDITFNEPTPFQTTLDSVDISVQREKISVLSYGRSTTLYSNSSATYSSTLENQCALVEFTTNRILKEKDFYIMGINNRVTIDFANNTFTPSNEGNITLYPETPTNRWAILLPSEEPVTVTVNAEGYDNIGITIPPVKKNDFLHGENAVSFKLTAMDADDPLTMTVMGGDGIINVSNPSEGMKYSINDGNKKPIICEFGSNIYSIEVSHDDEVHFYGNGTNGSTNIIVNSNVMLSGNIMSLVDEENFATITTMEGASFAGLFAGNNSPERTIINANGLLLPATTLSENCYSRMFAGCSELTDTPVELPALTLAPGCYSNMFEGCDKLSDAPHLPAPELVDRCYASMFYQCGTLQNVTCLATTINGTDCTTDWLYEVNFPGTFTKAKGATCWDNLDYDDGIPWGWEVNEY